MNDVEHDLRELFERKASSVGGVAPRLPEPVRKRGRRRQLGTAFVSGLTALAVLAGTVGIIRAVDTGRDRQPTPADDPWAGYEVFERTATVGNFTITSPSDWYLVNQWPWARTLATDLQEQRERDVEACGEEPTQDERQACRSSLMGVPGDGWAAPILMLSDTDRGLESSPCFDRSFSIGSEDAVMTIALDSVFMAANFGAGDRAQWPVPFDTPPAAERPSCGPGTYVYFASGDIPYVAHFAFGDAVPEDERRTLIDAFEGMQVDDSQEAFMDEPKPDDAAAYVIAGGESAAGPWRLELRPSGSSDPKSNVALIAVHAEGGEIGLGDVILTDIDPIQQAGGDPTFGAVKQTATGVELRLEPGTPPIPAALVPLPPSMPFGFDLFFASNPTDVPAEAVAVDADGVAMHPTEPMVSPPVHTTVLDEVEHLGSGQRWAPAVTEEGGRVVMPVTFPDGATAELVYSAALQLEDLNVYPDMYGTLGARSDQCGWPVHATRHDPRDGWIRGDGPLDRTTTVGRIVELWEGTRSHAPYDYLVTRAGRWNVIVGCRTSGTIEGDVAVWAEHLSGSQAADGLLVVADSGPLDMHPDESATIRLSDDELILDIEVSPAECQGGGATDLGSGDGVVEWCSGDVHVYANAFEAVQEPVLAGIVDGLEIRGYRPGAN